MPKKKKKNRANHRSPGTRAEDRVKALSMYVQGKTYSEISGLLGVSYDMIRRDMARQRRIWNEENLDKIGEIKNHQIQVQYEIIREAWKSWEDSKRDRERITESESIQGPSSSTTTERTEGNPRYLELVIKATQELAKMLGLYVPEEKKAEIHQHLDITQIFNDQEKAEQYRGILQEYATSLRHPSRISDISDQG